MTTFDRNMSHAQLLLQQQRFDLAKGPLRQALGEDPDNALACAWLAWCHLREDDYGPATELAERAVSLDPEEAFLHFVLGSVYFDRDMPKEAMREAQEALRLDPSNADHWRLLSGLHAGAKRWTESLGAAERGLALDGEHAGCAHMRVMALRGLGRKAEAMEASRGTLERDPDSPVAHANAGWTCLHRGEIRQAKTHFREALRLDPGLDWARAGMVEAIKATNPIYRVFLRYMLWMATKSGKVQWAVIIVGWLGYQVARTALASNPQFKPFLLPLIVTYVAFVLLTWFATPLFNLMLLVHPFGRHAIRADQRLWASLFGLTLLISAAGWIGYAVTGLDLLFLIGGGVMLLVAPVASVGLCRVGKPRLIMLAYLFGLVAFFAALLAGAVLGWQGAADLVQAYVIGCLISMLLTNIVNSAPAAAKA
ncbi:MAG: tetratricopeptide repeat protein [Phycisphaerales bacterium]|nr:tetratricopeptide repeat protein [Phycisphaerales bacterium]